MQTSLTHHSTVWQPRWDSAKAERAQCGCSRCAAALSSATTYTKERSNMADRAGGLHDRLNRIAHWDVNVTDLERSRAWYEATTTLRVIARTKASQRFPSF